MYGSFSSSVSATFTLSSRSNQPRPRLKSFSDNLVAFLICLKVKPSEPARAFQIVPATLPAFSCNIIVILPKIVKLKLSFLKNLCKIIALQWIAQIFQQKNAEKSKKIHIFDKIMHIYEFFCRVRTQHSLCANTNGKNIDNS